MLEGENIEIKPVSVNNYDDILFIPSFLDELDSLEQIPDSIKKCVSSGTYSLFICTPSGTMNEVYGDKKHEEVISFMLFDEYGELDISKTIGKMCGHGNTTWQKEKKPFSICFEQPISIAGMESSSEWILLANSYDKSYIRNKIVLDSAIEMQMPVSPQCEYVSLYLNGEYNGLYLLTQSVQGLMEKQENVALAFSEMPDRQHELKKVIALNNNVLVGIKNMSLISDGQFESIRGWIQEADEIVTSELDENLEEIVDIDSWSSKYLIDEVFENYDAGISSAFFYFYINEELPSKIFAGPIWDYDNCAGNTNAFCGDTINPEILYASNYMRSDVVSIMWYASLMKNSAFRNIVKKKFSEIIYPYALNLIQRDIDCIIEKHYEAIRCDCIRWQREIEEVNEEVCNLINWLEKRILFLKSIWIDEENYNVVTIHRGRGYTKHLYVYSGELLSSSSYYSFFFDPKAKYYHDGAEFNPNEEICTNIDLVEDTNLSTAETFSHFLMKNKLLILGLSIILIMAIISICAFVKTIVYGRQERMRGK